MTRSFIPSVFTILNLFSGFMSMLATARGEYTAAVWLIVLGALCDSFDGKLARALHTTSDFGVQFDSLADAITFCAAPAFFVYFVWSRPLGILLGGFFAFVPLILGSIRLAKFNVEAEVTQKDRFLGVPTPLAAMTITGLYLFYAQASNMPLLHWQPRFPNGDPRVALPLVMIVSSLMLSKVPFPKFPAVSLRKGWGNSSRLLLTLGMLSAVILSRGFLLFPFGAIIITGGLVSWSQTHRLNVRTAESRE